ncbi:MAG: fibronectin type III domain-containing protein [Acidimicrobiia bacterium]
MIREPRSRVRQHGWKVWLCGVAIVGGALSAGSAGAANVSLPGAPKITSVTAGTRSVTVTFINPANDGGTRILTYEATCTSIDGGVTDSDSAPTSPVRVGGLTNNKTYTCSIAARNDVGLGTASVSSAAVVARPTVAAAPTITSVTAGDHSVTVVFRSPADDGGAPIRIFQVECTSKAGRDSGRRDAATSPISVTDLAGNRTYTCTVAASNRIGLGAASAPSRPTVARPIPPEAPTITSVAPGNHSVTVTFTNPAKDGGARIATYQARCTSKNGGITHTHNAPTSPIRVRGLTAAKTYRCTVAASNRAGLGTASAASQPVIPRSH